jgi:hypothetical protein
LHFDVAARVINRFYWNLTVEEVDGEVRLRSGDGLVGRFASMAALEVFTAGMALVLYVLPARRPARRLVPKIASAIYDLACE